MGKKKPPQKKPATAKPRAKRVAASTIPAPKRMRVQGFVKEFVRLDKTMPDRPFLFILGAGASVASGIPAAGALVDCWLRELHEQDADQDGCPFEQWAAENRIKIEGFNSKDPAASYSNVYARRFGSDPDKGYACLEELMGGKRPSYGYTVLARILAVENHKIVITVNFDNLVADALAMVSDVFPLVCGHESLIQFAKSHPRRPVVLKVHNDLLLGAKNRPDEIGQISVNYRNLLEKLLKAYTPIVIGYGGNDGSLMSALSSLKSEIPGGIYWCHRIGSPPGSRICQFVARQNGHLVGIPDFDSLMVMLGEALDLGPADQIIRDRAAEYADRMGEEFGELRKRLAAESNPTAVVGANGKPDTSPESAERATAVQAAVQAMDATARKPEGPRRWWQWLSLAQAESDPDKKEAIYRDAVQALPADARVLGSYANFLTDIRKNHDAAEALYKRAIAADPKYATALANYATFLTEIRENHDAAEALYNRAIEADPEDAVALTNYANFLTEVRKDHDAAEALYKRAAEAKPDHPGVLANHATFLKRVRKEHRAAEAMFKRAIEADPKDAYSLGSYASFLTDIRKDHLAAETMYKRAIEADPTDANNLGNYARLLLADGRNAEGMELVLRAMALRTANEADDQDAELLFYTYAHGPAERRPDALQRLRALLEQGVRSPGWDLSRNVERATADGHPEAPWLPKLAAVVAEQATADTLGDWPAWKAAAGSKQQ